MEPVTRDSFFDGRIVLHQPKHGYRFSIDAVILAHLSLPKAGEKVLDLGAGCGVIPIMLAHRHAAIHLTAVEIQSALAGFARQNVTLNQMADRIRIVEKDMAKLSQGDVDGPVDLVVSNPPYRKRDSGRINSNGQRAMARHELTIDLPTLLHTARRLLRKMGRLAVIYPAVRSVDLLSAMRTEGIEPKRLTMVHARAASAAQLVVVAGVNGGRPGLEVTRPLQVYNDNGTYTPVVDAMFKC
ncbi:tRNA1(Val) (adenine(37)-N6)-methyltransferase [Desulfosarcina ovata]|uniref:SAM-dependent methyltransferase n=2 Tax=Desulfosarcina ovata TaxID=83564 RepID=A0A5K8A9Q6_9BACT|nr:methyltransferase [Desulfosarcina ovata]BBO81679.1 SAM-dependent methyltransferase [Desulfosarcina ovata subsp. sediminis]BBO88914.1 SAM-dependent methyltransferase [Desulfosarcina ovata subsp. ovata]